MKKTKILTIMIVAMVLMLWSVWPAMAMPMGTAWTYQGRLMDDSSTADGLYDFQFKLFDDVNTVTGNQVGNTIDINDLDVVEGQFTVELDFGINVFNGDARWLETTVAQSDGSDPCTLRPLLELTPAPYAIYAETAGAGHSLDAADGYPTDVVYVNNGGYVGIGTTDPLSKLSVAGAGYFSGNVGIGTTNPATKLYIQMFGSSTPIFPPYNRPGLVIKGGSYNIGNQLEVQDSSGNTRFLVDSAGNVGIGTTSPQNKLEVEGAVAIGASYFGSETAPTNGMIIEGNVGIGTTNPLSKLSVGGDGTANTGVCGSGSDYGVYGIGDNGLGDTVGVGVYGVGDFIGVSGRDSDTSSFGFLGNHNKGGYFVGDHDRSGFGSYGVYGWAIASGGTNYGIYGKAENGTTNYAGYFDGDVRVNGNLMIYSGSTLVLELGTGLDYAEGFDVSESTKIDAGSVLIIDAENPGKLALSTEPYDSKVAGIVAGANGIGSGVRLGTGEFDHDVALAGRVYCNVDTTQAGVEPGDLLTTSATPGYAMKSTDYARAQGAILGKAMESLEKGQKGQILVLVTLQ